MNREIVKSRKVSEKESIDKRLGKRRPYWFIAAMVLLALFAFHIPSTFAGFIWTQQTTTASIHNWRSIASSSDGTKLAAVSGYIYTSADSGATWTANTTSGSRNWYSIASSADGTKLAAVVYGGYIYTSADSGVTWAEWTASGI